MRIKGSDVKSNTVRGIIQELENNKKFMAEIDGKNLNTFDFLEMIATELAFQDNDVDTNDFLSLAFKNK